MNERLVSWIFRVFEEKGGGYFGGLVVGDAEGDGFEAPAMKVNC